MDMSEKKQIRRNSRKKNIFFTYQIELAGSLIGIFLTVGLLAVILLIIFFSLENSSTTSPLPWQYLYSDKSEDMIKDAEGNIVPGKKEGPITLTFAGDILFDTHYAAGERIASAGIQNVIDPSLIQEMQAADVAILNNEFPYAEGGSPTPGKRFTFHASPESAENYRQIGVNLVTLANNHIFDYGEAGLKCTLEALNNAGISHIGAGNNLSEAADAYHFFSNACKISILSATDVEAGDHPDTRGATDTLSGVFRTVEDSYLLQRVREEKEKGFFVIVIMHWGTESTSQLNWMQEKQAPEIAAAGAGLILGAHPHVLQKMEFVGETPVFYSLGNFYFNSKKADTGMVKAVIDHNALQSVQFIPAIQSNLFTSRADEGEASRIFSYLNRMSGSATLQSDGTLKHR